MRLPALVALLIVAVLPVATPGVAPVSAPRVLLVGLDAADWQAIDPLVSSGRLPAFAVLSREGRTAVLQATPPLVSPLLWTTIATGRPPEDHGVLDFMVDLPSGEQAPIGSASRRVAALWNVVSDAGRTVSVVGWWATWPAERVRGTIVSDRVAPQLTRARGPIEEGSIAPPETAAALLPLVTAPDRVTRDDIARYVPLSAAEFEAARRAISDASLLYRNPIAHLSAVIAGTRTYSAIAEHQLRSAQPDLFAVYFEAIDTISHLFVADATRGPHAIARAYEEADRVIARLAAAAAPDTLVIVCSDHGFQRPTAGIRESPSNLAGPATAWHRPYGIIAVIEAGRLAASKRGRATGDPARDPVPAQLVSPLDIAPTVLHALGLPVSREMPGRVLDDLLPGPAHGRGRAVAWVKTYEAGRRQAPDTRTAKVDPAARARLQALGYIGAATTSLAGQNLGEVLYRAGRLEAAERQLVAVVERQPTNVAAHLWLAKTRRDLGRRQQALSVYERVLRLDPDAGEALLEAVDVALAAGLMDRAKAIVAASGKQAQGAWRRTAAGAIAAAERREREAEREFRSALAADPLAYEPLSRLVDVLIAGRRGAEAVPAVRAAVAQVPDSPRHQALLGEALLAARDAAGAEAAFARALALAPDGIAVRLGLARAQLVRQRAAQAVETLGPVPASAERSRLLGAAYSAVGRWKEAAAEFRSALAAGESSDLLNGLGWAEHRQGRGREAIEAFQRSLALNPDQPQIRELVATLKASRVPGWP